MSPYVSRQFEAAHIADISHHVIRGRLLKHDDAQRLTRAPLPLLAKLVSLRPGYEPCDCPGVELVVCLPLAEQSSPQDRNAAISKAEGDLREARNNLASLIEVDERVRQFGNCLRTLHVAINAPEDSDRSILEVATEQLAQDAEETGILVLPAGYAAREVPIPQDQAADALREIAVTCLTSADHDEIRAPVGRLGIKTAHVALSFGANHLGRVAVDDETAAMIGLPTLTELADALRFDTPTTI